MNQRHLSKIFTLSMYNIIYEFAIYLKELILTLPYISHVYKSEEFSYLKDEL